VHDVLELRMSGHGFLPMLLDNAARPFSAPSEPLECIDGGAL
jgi:hypothetical protein